MRKVRAPAGEGGTGQEEGGGEGAMRIGKPGMGRVVIQKMVQMTRAKIHLWKVGG